MSINTTASRIQYSGNGVSTAFAFPYYFIQNGDLVVILTDANGVETIQVITTNYTVTGAGDAAGGTITMLVAPPSGYSLTVYRDPAVVQNLTLIQNDPLPAADVEAAFDLSTMQIQRVKDLVGRAVALPDGFPGSFDTELPTTPDTVIAINSAGTGLTAGPTIAQIAAAAIAAAAAIPSVCKSYTTDANFVAAQGSPAIESNFYYNSTMKSFRMYLNGSWRTVVTNVISPEVFGAVGDGVADDTVPIQNALNAVPANGGDVVLSQKYRISASLVPQNNTRIIGTRGGTLTIAANTTISGTAGRGFIDATDLQNFSCQGVTFLHTGVWTSTPFANPYAAGNSVGFTNDDYGVQVRVNSGVDGIVVEDCKFTGFSRAINVNNNGSGRLAKNVSVRNNRITVCGFGGIFLYYSAKFVITGNLVEKVYGNITAAGDTSLANSKFGDGIGLNSAVDGIISNNSVFDYQRTGLIIEPYAANVGNGTTTNGSKNITSVSAGIVTILAALLADGQVIGVVGTGIPTGTKLASASGTTVVTDTNSTASATVSIQYVLYSTRLVLDANVINYQHDGRGAQDWTGIYIGDGFTQQPIVVSAVTIFNIFGDQATFAAATNGDGIVCEGCHVSGGSIKNCGGSGLVDVGGENSFIGVKVTNNNNYGLRVIHNDVGNMSCLDCEFTGNGFAGITLSSVTNSFLRIVGNFIKDNGALTTPLGSGHEGLGLAGITAPGVDSSELLIIEKNTFVSSVAAGATLGQLYGISIYVSGNYCEHIRDNKFIFTDATVKNLPATIGAVPCSFATEFNTGGYTLYDLFAGSLFARGNDCNKKAWTNDQNWIGAADSGYLRILGYAAAAPVAGTYRRGDAFLNSAMSGSSLPFIWVCTTAGTPGTWKALTLS